MQSRKRQKYYVVGDLFSVGENNLERGIFERYRYDQHQNIWGVKANDLTAAFHPSEYRLYTSLDAAKEYAPSEPVVSGEDSLTIWHSEDEKMFQFYPVAEVYLHSDAKINHTSISYGSNATASYNDFIFLRTHCFSSEETLCKRRGNHDLVELNGSVYKCELPSTSDADLVAQNSCQNSVVEGVRALFRDYAHPPLFSFHWNLHHKPLAKTIADHLPRDADSAFEYLQERLQELKGNANMNGLMVRRLNYAIAEIAGELEYGYEGNHDRSLKTPDWFPVHW